MTLRGPMNGSFLSNTQAMNTRATIKVALRVSSYSHMGKYGGVFDLTLVFTSFRVEGEEYLLASEDDMLIITEDGESAIDLSEYD